MIFQSAHTLSPGWKNAIGDEFDKPYMDALSAYLQQEKQSGQIVYPPEDNIFNALVMTPLEDVKVVILGQDPYHGEGQAHGLAFSVQRGVRRPPSLINIYKEIERDFAVPMPQQGDLSNWARQGVLLLNTTLTVRATLAGSHQKRGWETFTDAIIRAVNEQRQHVVFLLWGSHAQKKGAIIQNDRHCVLQAPHPSPLSAHRGFLGCGHFRQANEYLIKHGHSPINWTDIPA